VEEQIKVARGEELSWQQEDIGINGHAIELRVYAEDPYNNFLPSIGKLKTYQAPEGKHIRVDDGFREGMDIPIYYDPMISKLVVHHESREKAIHAMIEAIQNYTIDGVETTLGFGRFVMQHPEFIKGTYDTQFVDQYFTESDRKRFYEEEEEVAAIIALRLLREQRNRVKKVLH
jgi:acetyl/propionyl-CoA carboxylase alpha subunit